MFLGERTQDQMGVMNGHLSASCLVYCLLGLLITDNCGLSGDWEGAREESRRGNCDQSMKGLEYHAKEFGR